MDLHITHVSTADLAGGAERVAVNIHLACLDAGIDSTLAVGFKFLDLPGSVLIPNDAGRGLWARSINALAPVVPAPPSALPSGKRALRRALKAVAEPIRAWRIAQGLEDVDFPGTRKITALSESRPNVVQLHNLHGGYFDIRELPGLCAMQPTVLTVHDTWLTSGHCAYSVDCSAWLEGCGACPHLDFPPRVTRDRTRENWQMKRRIFADPRTRLHLVSPSKWALERMLESMAAPAIASSRVIVNGVDQHTFRPGDKLAARAALGIDPDALVFAFTTANSESPYKDPATIEAALRFLAEDLSGESVGAGISGTPALVFLMLGAAPSESLIEGVEIIRIPFLPSPADVAQCLQAADVYLHAARAEVLPLGILEAQSCGLPSIVTRTGGAPECVADGETGFVTTQGDPREMASAAKTLALDSELRLRMGRAAQERAGGTFDLNTMTARYIELYRGLASEGDC